MSTNRKCGCGKSPTGFCIGWHALSPEEYKVKLAEYKKQQQQKEQK